MNNPNIIINFRGEYRHSPVFICSLIHRCQIDLSLRSSMYNDTSSFLGHNYFLNSTKDLATILNKINLYENSISDIDAIIRDIANAP